MYFCGCPIAWKSVRQSVRSYSSAEAEYIAASDTIILTESNDFTDFFRVLPTTMAEPKFGMVGSSPDYILWVDNTSAINTAQDSDYKPKSRHYALRWHRVRDQGKRIMFVPTTLQKADGLTKLSCSVEQRDLLLKTNFLCCLAIGGQVYNPSILCDGDYDDDGVETDGELCTHAFSAYLVF